MQPGNPPAAKSIPSCRGLEWKQGGYLFLHTPVHPLSIGMWLREFTFWYMTVTDPLMWLLMEALWSLYCVIYVSYSGIIYLSISLLLCIKYNVFYVRMVFTGETHILFHLQKPWGPKLHHKTVTYRLPTVIVRKELAVSQIFKQKIFHLGKISRPLMIFRGKNVPRTFPERLFIHCSVSLKMYGQFERLKHPVWTKMCLALSA